MASLGMHGLVTALALLGLASAGAGARAAAPAGPPLAHVFGAAPDATSAPDVEILVRAPDAQVRLGGASGRERIDLADYSRALRLVAARELVMGPGDPPTTLPSGTYEGDVVATSAGGLRLVLHGASGLRVSMTLAGIDPLEPPPSRAVAEAMPQPGDAWWIALHLPTASGAFVLAPAGNPGPGRTRTEVIRKKLRERLLHSGRPARRSPRE